jgi:hypothetical protein
MSLTKTLAGIVAFAIALGAAVLITRHYAPPPAPPPPAPAAAAPAPEAPPPPARGASGISHEAQLITLDFEAKRSHTTLALERDPARPAPERLWVRTYLFTKDGSAAGYAVCGGLPVEVRRPFVEGNRKTLTVTTWAAKCREPSDPAGTYYARVNVSAESPGAAELGALPENYNIATGSPVVLQKGQGGSR